MDALVPIRRNFRPLAMLSEEIRGAKPRQNSGVMGSVLSPAPLFLWATAQNQTDTALANAPITQASEAAQRYASALFELAQDKGQLSEVHRSFADFAALIRESEDLSRLIASPAFSRDDKKAALLAISDSAGVTPLVKNMLGVMAQNGRAREILGAQRAFDTLYANQRGVKRAMARTAKSMSADQRARLEAILAKAVGGEVELSEEVDESLIGGIQLQIGSTLVDASLAAKLDRMNSAMKGA